ncbi:MAG: DUF2167 domain-containing protein [Verrucomicrobiales bacterium]|nr:DUF2167 domain-containing protein [Verrucomicrobiales bacterium]
MKKQTRCTPGGNLAAILMMIGLALPVMAQQESPPADGDASAASTEAEIEAAFEAIGWQREGVGELDKWAELTIPEGFRFTKNAGAVLEMTGNIPSGEESGVIAKEDFSWWVLFRFNDIGYVKDDEKDKIDPVGLLKQKQEMQELGNEERRDMGLDELFVEGWAREPFYNEQSNNLEWALTLRAGDGGRSVNYNSKILGRSGFMDAVLVCDPEQLDAVLPEFQSLIQGYRFKSGETYAEYTSGDRLAKVGLTALIVGGGAAAAAKTGLFAGLFKFFGKLGKAAILLVAAVVAGIVNAFKRLFGRH